MPVYKLRWPNGNFSFVSAASQQEAIEALDEIDNAEGCPLSVVEDFMVHFHLEEDGTFGLKGSERSQNMPFGRIILCWTKL